MKILRHSLLFINIAILLLLLTQCRQVSPPPPTAQGFDDSIPPTISYVAGSVVMPLRELEDKINQELDPVLVGKKPAGREKGSLFAFRVIRSGRVQIHYENQQIRFSAPLQLWLLTPLSGREASQNRPFCSLQVHFQSPLTVTSNWRVASQVKFTNYEWIEEPQIHLLGKAILLTKLVRNVLDRYQSAIESAINSAIYEGLKLDQIVGPIWQDMQKPLLIDRQYGLWLLPRPVSIEASPVQGNSQQLITPLRIAFQTRTALSPSQPAYSPTSLPLLQKRAQLATTSDLHVLSFIPYTDINQMLARQIGQQPIKLAWGALTIRKATVYGSQRSLIVKAEVSGLLDGTLYLRGRPAFDTLTKTLKVNDLTIDVATQDVLPKLAGLVVNKSLLSVVGKLVVMPLDDEIAKLPQVINKAFEKGGAGAKTDLTLQNFYFNVPKLAVRPDGIQALIRVTSNVSVQVKEL